MNLSIHLDIYIYVCHNQDELNIIYMDKIHVFKHLFLFLKGWKLRKQ